MNKLARFLKKLGPGLITGASDDDPSGIVIYAQTGAASGTNLLWTAPFTFPFMAAIQEMCARIGLVTGRGLIGAMRHSYPPVFLILIALLIVVANTVNIGADIAGMASVINLFIPLSPTIVALLISLLLIGFMIYFPYRVLATIFKWLTLSLFAYIVTSFMVASDWKIILRDTFLPHLNLDKEHLLLILAIFGTTISPYLFFWQASQEAEEKKDNPQSYKSKIVTKNELKTMRNDVAIGMLLSNLVMYFIIIASAQTLPKLGIYTIEMPDQAAQALVPFVGDFAKIVFSLGIIGTGMLAIPVLAGSAAYAVSEAFGWRKGLSLAWSKAKSFYSIIILATFVGFLLTELGLKIGLTPFRALFITGAIYGVLSPIMILIILSIANNKKILGDKVNGFFSNVMGVATFVMMSIAVLVLVLV